MKKPNVTDAFVRRQDITWAVTAALTILLPCFGAALANWSSNARSPTNLTQETAARGPKRLGHRAIPSSERVTRRPTHLAAC